MPPRNRNTTSAAVSPSASQPTYSNPSASGAPVRRSSSTTSNVKNAQDVQQILQGIWQNYVDKTPQRVKLIDAFMAFLVLVGGLQFVYCVVAGNYVSTVEVIGMRMC
jgi:oligosaccharyltransferase complex subunit epsilon